MSSEDPAALPARVIRTPGAEYSDSARHWQGIPTITRAPGGRLWASWYSGGKGEGPYNYVVVVTSGDNGQNWSAPQVVIQPSAPVRAYDPCLWTDPRGRVWLFWAQSFSKWDGRGGVWAITASEPDEPNPQWSAPRRIANGVMMNKPTVLTSGEWLLPIAVWARPSEVAIQNKVHQLNLDSDALLKRSHHLPDEHGSAVWASTDDGKTWRLRGKAPVPDSDFDEHMVVERRDGSLWMLARTRFGIGETVSHDRGRTWANWTDSGIPHPVTRFFIRRLASGNLLMIRHHEMAGKTRSHLAAYVSKDDGKTWTGGLMLDERQAVSYPDAIEAPDGLIYAVYDFERHGAKEILLTVFREADAKEGKWVSGDARQRVVINKGGLR